MKRLYVASLLLLAGLLLAAGCLAPAVHEAALRNEENMGALEEDFDLYEQAVQPKAEPGSATATAVAKLGKSLKRSISQQRGTARTLVEVTR